MKCEYCDSIIREVPDNGVCPNCGAPLRVTHRMEECKKRGETSNSAIDFDFPEAPVGTYKDAAGHLEVKNDSIVFLRRHFIKAHIREIMFRDIFAVAYSPGVTLNSGFLCVREWKDRNIPMPKVSADAVFDETAVYFIKSDNEKFRRVYDFLKECSEIVQSNNKHM